MYFCELMSTKMMRTGIMCIVWHSETKKTIGEIFNKYKLIIDPHTAVGLSVGDKELNNKEKRIYIEKCQ